MEMGMFILKALSNLSLVFIMVNFVFGMISGVPPWHLLLFLGEIILSFFVYYLKKQKHRKMYLVLFLLAAVPLPFLPLADIPYVLFNSIFAIYVGLSGIKLKTDYWLMTEIFGKGLVIVVVLTLLLLVLGNSNDISKNYTFYIFIFLVSSVYLMRTLRHLIYNDNELELRKINLSYSLATLITAFILGSSAVRGFLGYVLESSYNAIVGITVYLLSWLVLPLVYLLMWFAQGLKAVGRQGLPPLTGLAGSPLKPLAQSADRLDILLMLQRALRVPINILLILLLFYGLLKLLRQLNDSGQEKEECRETREFILSSGQKTSLFPKISGIFASRNGIGAIRHYYKQFLSLSLKREINILHSDTTLEIEKKGEPHFDKDILETMRTIYLQVRYGSEPCGEETVNKFRRLFKRLVQGK